MRHENVTEQADRLLQAELQLACDLDRLAGTATAARRRRTPIEDVYGAMEAVRRAEEARDLAQLDLDTARGADA